MIRAEYGMLEVRGSKIEIMSDISVILYDLKKRGILTKEDIDAIVNYAKMSENELEKSVKESKKELLKAFSELLDDIISKSESE